MTAALSWFSLSVALHAQTVAQVKDIQVPKITRAPVIEDFLNGASRSDMKRIDDFRQRRPGDGVPVSRKTTAWIGYDDLTFYAVFVCQAPAGSLRARLSRREDLFNDDLAGIFFDTYHDRQRSYEFFVNPLGVQADAIATEGQGDDFSFDTLWYSQGRVTPEGFVAVLAIPFRSLRFSTAEQQTWGFGLYRGIPANNESSFWPFITEKVEGFTQQLGNLSGLERISPGRNLQFIPYGTFGHSHFLDQAIPSYRSKTDVRAGFDFKAVLRGSLTLDIAVNPDFSQVESDDPQVTVNQRFEVVFPEKRPFFLENNGFFTTPENLFFSRRIVDPEFGARLTGKLGRWNIGVLGADDRAPGRAPAGGGRAAIGVFRVQREFSRQSNIGLLITERDFAGSYNRVGALDTRLKLNPNWTVNAQAIASHTHERDGSHSGGSAYNIALRGQSRKFYYDWNYTDRGEGFHTDLGFVPRVDIRQITQVGTRHFRPKSKVLLSWGPFLFASGIFDRRNVQQDWHVRPGLNFELARSTYFGFSHGQSFERFRNINFRLRDTNISGHTEYFKRVTFDGNFSKGTRINYAAAGALKPFLGQGSEARVQLTLRPAARMKLDEIYYLTRLRTLPAAPGAHPEPVFVNHLARSRLSYQFTRELSLRLILDYNGVLENPSLVSLSRQKRVTGDILLTYLIHPGTAIYVGYTDRLENLALSPGSLIVRTGAPSTTVGRQFFAKVSYLFRF